MAKKVIIIGAGIAGISAALELINANYEIHLYEQKNEIGGRVSSIFDKFSNEYIDNGQHLLIGAYHNFLNFLEKIKRRKYIEEQTSLSVTFLDNNLVKDTLNTSKLPWKFGVIYGLFSLRQIDLQEKVNLIILFIKIQLDLVDFKDISCSKFLKNENQSKNVIQRFWEPLILAILNNDIKSASAELMVISLKKAFFSDSSNSKLIFPIVNLNKLVSNFTEVFIQSGGFLHLTTKIDKLIIENESIVGIQIKGEVIKADFVIVAIPPNSLIKLIDEYNSNKYFSYLKEFKYSPIISAFFWFDKPILDEKFLAVIGSKTQWIFDRKKILIDEYQSNNESITVTISNAESIANLSNAEISSMIYEELKILLQINENTKLLHSRVIKEMMATISITPDIEKIRPNTKTSIKNLYLAGDWTNTKLPATIEGACQSGIEASKKIIESNLNLIDFQCNSTI